MEYAALCDIGKKRKMNQDAVFASVREGAGLFLVADGMGGHSHGEKASRRIVQAVWEWWDFFSPEQYQGNFLGMIQSLKQAVEQANLDIYETYNQKDVCGSTIAALFIFQGAYGILSAGDSRVYLHYRWKFRQMTTDDVWENQTCLSALEKERGWGHNHGKLCNAVGTARNMNCRVLTDEVKPGMVFLVCSDGLYKYCPEWFLKKCLLQTQIGLAPRSGTNKLLKKVYREDAGDNVSIIIVKV